MVLTEKESRIQATEIKCLYLVWSLGTEVSGSNETEARQAKGLNPGACVFVYVCERLPKTDGGAVY